jgi:hypothetical protein
MDKRVKVNAWVAEKSNSDGEVAKVEAGIKEKFPNEQFALSKVSLTGENKCEVEIFCNKSLFKKLINYSKEKIGRNFQFY